MRELFKRAKTKSTASRIERNNAFFSHKIKEKFEKQILKQQWKIQ